jgi:formate hydrogenlyase subunit 4
MNTKTLLKRMFGWLFIGTLIGAFSCMLYVAGMLSEILIFLAIVLVAIAIIIAIAKTILWSFDLK